MLFNESNDVVTAHYVLYVSVTQHTSYSYYYMI